MAEEFYRMDIIASDVFFTLESLGYIVSADLNQDLRHAKTLFSTFMTTLINWRFKCDLTIAADALVILLTVFEALQFGSVTSTPVPTRRKLTLESPVGVTASLFELDF